MKKIIAVYLKSINYSGDSIGNDIFVEIKCADQSVKIDRKINRGDTAEINKEIGYFETDENILNVSIHIKITEDDILFDDVGQTQGMMAIDVTTLLPENHIFEIKVAESKGGRGRRVAVFKVILEAIGAIRYVEDVDNKGWLEVVPNNKNEVIALPIYLKVQLN